MNREMRRLQEREDRRQKKAESGTEKANRKAAALSARQSGERQSLWARFRNYLHEVRQELKKVTWPTRDQMTAFTTVTVITSVVLTGVIFGLDIVMKEAVFWLLDLI